jgi:hypothetical protein
LLAALKSGAVKPIKTTVDTPASVAPMVGPVIPSAAQALELYRAGNTAGAEAMLKSSSGLTAAAPVASTAAPVNTLGVSLSNLRSAVAPKNIAPNIDSSTGFPILDRDAIDETMNKYLTNPSYVRSYGTDMMPSNIYRSNFDKFGWNVKSDASSILRGRAIFGLTSGYSTDQLINTAKIFNIPVENYYKTITDRGRTSTVIDNIDLLKEIDRKTDGMYYVTNSIDGTNKHASVFYKDDGTGRLIPQKDADGNPVATTFTAETVKKSNWYDLPLEALRVGAPMVISAYVTGNPNFTFTQQVGINAAAQLASGAPPEDVVRNITATVAANSLTAGIPGVESSKIIPKTLNEINKNIANLFPNAVSPTTASALINAERQAVAALITEQDVGQNAIAGAVGGAVADIAQFAVDDPLIQKAIGEYTKYNALGMSPVDAALMAGVDYAGDVANQPKQKTPGTSTDEQANSYYKQFEEVFSQPRTPGIGSQLGEATAELSSIGGEKLTSAVPGGIGTEKPLFDGSEFSVGVNQQAGPVKNIIVEGKTYQTRDITDASGTTTYYFDPIDKKVTARPVTSVGDTAGGTEIKTLSPVEVTGGKTFDPTDLTAKQPIIIGGGKGGSGGSNVPIKPGISGVAGGGSTTGAVDTITGATTGGGGGAATGAATGATTGATSGSITGTPTGAIADATKVTSPTTSTLTPAEQDGLSLLQRVNDGFRTDTSSTGVDKKLPPVEVTGDKENLLNVPRLPVVTDVTGEDNLKKLPPVEVTYEDEIILNTPKLPPVEVTYEDETILKPPPPDEPDVTDEPDVPITKPPILLDLINTPIVDEPIKRRPPTTEERTSMQALLQGLSIGDPGDALFGGKLGKRRNVWNKESLRLKDELGG